MFLAAGIASPASAAVPIVTVASGSPENARELTPYKGKLYLSGRNGGDFALYQFDGSEFSLVPGAPARPSQLFVLGDLLYFEAYVNSTPHFFSFDGTTVSDLGAMSYQRLFVTDTEAYFREWFTNALLRFDGTSFTTLPGAPGNVSGGVKFNGDLFVVDSNFDQTIAGLYGESGGTFTPIFSGTVHTPYVFDGLLYFSAFTGGGWTLFSYDGTSAPAEVVALPADARYMVAYDGALHLSLSDFQFAQLVRLDGNQLSVVVDGKPETSGLKVVGEQLYFSAFDDLTYSTSSAYVVNGTSAEPFLTPSFYARDFTEFGGAVYFTSSETVDLGPRYVYRIGAASAAPALAATGLELAGPGALALLLLSVGAVLIARRREYGSGSRG